MQQDPIIPDTAIARFHVSPPIPEHYLPELHNRARFLVRLAVVPQSWQLFPHPIGLLSAAKKRAKTQLFGKDQCPCNSLPRSTKAVKCLCRKQRNTYYRKTRHCSLL